MDEEVYSEFITQTLKLPEDSLVQFYLIVVAMNRPKLGHIKYDNYEKAFTFLQR